MQHRAIETRYKGYRFRSRLEARWAVFFDTLGLTWEYEPEGFELSGGRRYLPDFRLVVAGGVPLYVEVKPQGPMTQTDKDKIQAFARLVQGDDQDTGLIVVRGDPMAADAFLFGVFDGQRKAGPLSFDDYANTWCLLSRKPAETVKAAAFDARGARFEHGESGAARG